MRYDKADPKKGIQENDPTDKMKHHTFIFHTFVLMNLFNQINCRVINDGQKNIFRTIFNNYLFWLIFIFEMALQNYMVLIAPSYKLGSALLQVAEITQGQTITAWCLGAGTLLASFAFKFIPLEHFQWFTDNINLEEDLDDNKLLQFQSLVNERMNTLNKDMDGYLNKMDDQNVSVDQANSDDDYQGQINGQDDEDDDDSNATDNDSHYTSGSFSKHGGNPQGIRSSNVMRYSMRLTEMRDKKKK